MQLGFDSPVRVMSLTGVAPRRIGRALSIVRGVGLATGSLVSIMLQRKGARAVAARCPPTGVEVEQRTLRLRVLPRGGSAPGLDASPSVPALRSSEAGKDDCGARSSRARFWNASGALGFVTLAGVAMAMATSSASPQPLAGSVGQPHALAREKERDTELLQLSEGAWDISANDMNDDQRLDLVIATGGAGSRGGSVSVLFSPDVDRALADWERINLSTRGDYGRVAVGDINGDGVNDVAALTFGTRVLRWWLLGPDHSVLDERSISFSGAELSGHDCPGPALGAERRLTLSALAFADLDVDHQLELVVGAYSSGTEGGSFLFSFERQTGCFELRPGSTRAGRGSLRTRFFDVDGDGVLDIVSSHYALTRPAPGSASGCPGCLEWGQWWRVSGGAPEPLVARFGNRELLVAEPTPELNVVDFDALRTPTGARFALAGSAHLCPAENCWNAGRAGFVSVVDASGQELRGFDVWRQDAERAPPVIGARLLPRAVSFQGEVAQPSLAAAYWWATRRKDTPCSRVAPCAGPLTFAAGAAREARALEPAAFTQALAFVGTAGAPIEIEQRCQPAPTPLLPVPEAPIAAVVALHRHGRTLSSDRYSWVPGSNVVALAPDLMRDPAPVCLVYARNAGPPQLAVADSRQGLLLLAF
jgi:hypothetical protein